MSSSATMTSQKELLRLVDVSKSFTMGEVIVSVLHNLSFDILQREFLTIVGPSGSGKTTLLNLIGGLDVPTSGEVWYQDELLSEMTPRQLTLFRRQQVGFVFQLYNLVPNLTARENVLMATDLIADPLDADEALDLVGLSHRREHFPSQLSGGEQQRVSIARAVAKNPTLLLCDEPTGALDFQTGRQVLQLLTDLNKRLKTTVVVITHNAALAQVTQRTIHLRSGEVSQIDVNATPVDPMEVIW